MKITAYHIAGQINLAAFKTTYAGNLLHSNAFELFYCVDEDRYFYLFDYGAVVFANMPDLEISKNLLLLNEFLTHPLEDKLKDDFEITLQPEEPLTFGFDRLITPRLDENVLKIVLLNVAHSVALDFYAQKAQQLLAEIKQFTTQLEVEGAIRISRKNMLRFIGRTLNSQNLIIENLFIFDDPDLAWDDEFLEKTHRGLGRTFELQKRFKEVEYTFKVVEDNLSVFRELYLHRESKQLEWIVIILICIEVADLFISKIF